MQFQIDANSRTPIYRQLTTQVREGVARGKLSAGEKLPSVRELSRTLIVNPNTIAKAYSELERAGIVVTRAGVGAFVAEPNTGLTKKVRKERIAVMLDELLTEAVHLGLTPEEIIAMTKDRIKNFRWTQE